MWHAGAHAVPAAAVEEHVHQFAEAVTNTHKQTQASTTPLTVDRTICETAQLHEEALLGTCVRA
jgi:hypothetical protein